MKIFNKQQQYNHRKKLILDAIKFNNKTKTADKFNCDVKTVRELLGRFIRDGNAGLKDKSKRPHHSPNKISAKLEEYIINSRKQVPAFGPKRLKEYFDIPCHINTIGKVLKRNNLTIPHKKRSKKRIDMREAKKLLNPFENIQIDVKYLTDIAKYHPFRLKLGLPSYQYTARDVRTGALFVAYADSVSMTYATIFAKHLLKHLKRHNVDISKVTIQTDNGSEFGGTMMNHNHGFVYEIEKIGTNHQYIPPHRPNYNADVETVHHHEEREFFDLETYKSYRDFYNKITTYQYFWNFGRYNYSKGRQMPVDIMSKYYDGITSVKLLDFPPLLLNNRKKYLQHKNNLINFHNDTSEYVRGLAEYKKL
ncbi:MAG: leucine zipper domain-containing protein [Candidatus Marinimicrobia bacterium]|nr:leucine zipper domain-containing protein [Candidatus Neomarinimicrobiota bacterium]